MKTFFAVLAIFICPTFAFGDTIGPSTGCANSANVGDTYKLNLTYCSGNQLAGDSILGVADFSDRTANSISRREDRLHSPASNSKILITDMGLRYADGGIHEWSARADNRKSFEYALRGEPFESTAHVSSGSADNGKSFEYALRGEPFESAAHVWSASGDNGKSFEYALRGEPFESAAHVWTPLLTTNKSSVWADKEKSDLLGRNTDDFFRYAGSFARPTWFEDRKDTDNNRNKRDDGGKSGSGKNGKNGDNDRRGKIGGDDGQKGGGYDGGKGGNDDGEKGGDDGGKGGYDGHPRKIPEPSSLIMLGTGLLIGGALLRKFIA